MDCKVYQPFGEKQMHVAPYRWPFNSEKTDKVKESHTSTDDWFPACKTQ